MIYIKTYNDLLKVSEGKKADFLVSAINEHKLTAEYQTALDAEAYYKHQNPTIMKFQKFVSNALGQNVPDVWSANNKIASNWYFYFTVQAVQYLLGNGVSFSKDKTKEKLGKKFDYMMQKIATKAKNGGVAFGFWNADHLEVFSLLDFVPLYDEEDGILKAGIRFWQVDASKPLGIMLYEPDGYTRYIKHPQKPIEIKEPKKAYKTKIAQYNTGETELVDEDNYDGSLPIVPFWNVNKQSDLVGNQGSLDAWDLMASGLINNVSDSELIYWILKNCGDMNEKEDAQFLQKIREQHIVHADNDIGDGASVEAHQVNVPFQATDAALADIEKNLYKSFMALNPEAIAAGNVTATQIRAAYEELNEKTDLFEYQVTDFIQTILTLAGLDDEPSYVRSKIVNEAEEIETILSLGTYFPEEFIVKRICSVYGISEEQAQKIIDEKTGEEMNRFPVQAEPIVEEPAEDEEADEE